MDVDPPTEWRLRPELDGDLLSSLKQRVLDTRPRWRLDVLMALIVFLALDAHDAAAAG